MAELERWFHCPVLLAEAKGVAGLGKAGGDGSQGVDKAGQQVPPEVYMALTYAGTLFLFTLSVPLILYGLNKLLNKIEECFGCGASSKTKKLNGGSRTLKQQRELTSSLVTDDIVQQQPSKLVTTTSNHNENYNHNIISNHQDLLHPNNNNSTRQNFQYNQRPNLQLLQNQPKYSQFISMSKPDYNSSQDNMSLDKDRDHSPLGDRHQQQQQQQQQLPRKNNNKEVP